MHLILTLRSSHGKYLINGVGSCSFSNESANTDVFIVLPLNCLALLNVEDFLPVDKPHF